jgi:hypothetical protein
MKLQRIFKYSFIVGGLALLSSCKDFLDINVSPNSVLDAPIEQVFTSATTTVGFSGGSDLHRFTALVAQQCSGQGQGATTQTQEYERYNIQGSDLNNVWNLMYATTLSDLELVIQKAAAENSPHYAGAAKILKAYTYMQIADCWGKAPFSQALQFVGNVSPAFDNSDAIYRGVETMLNEAITDINSTTSVKSPASNSTIFPGTWSASKPRWEKLANTLKLRLLIHQSKKDRAGTVAAITSLVNSGALFMDSNSDNFQMSFVNAPRAQNPYHQFELDRANQFFPNATLVDLMNTKTDPRRARYFTQFPFGSGNYAGARGGDAPSFKYSRIHIYLRGDTTNATPVTPQADGSITATAYSYNGTAPVRMLTFAEYNFIRAEAALYGAPGDAQTFFQAGIRASMQAAGVATAQIDAYIAANGTLAGSESDKVRQIIEEKFVANFGVAVEAWNDWRRTGFPVISVPGNALFPNTPRSFFYPQSEIDLNANAPAQKANMDERVFWDAQ